MSERRRSAGRTSGVISAALLLVLTSPTFGWASRSVEPGDPAPEIGLRDVSGQEIVLSDHRGDAVLLVFWAEKNPVMKQHSWEVLAAGERLGRELADQGLKVLGVQFPPLGGADYESLVAEHGLTMPMLQAPDRSLYSAYGLFLLPTAVLLDRELRVQELIGYTRRLEQKLNAAAAVMVGVKSQKEVDAELRPQRVVVSDQAKQAARHYQLGRKLLDKGRLEKAMEELDQALVADPEHSAAHFARAEVHLLQEQADAALRAAAKGLDLDPQSRQGLLIHGRALAADGDSEAALEVLSELTGNDRLHAEALAALGDLHRQTGALEDAAKAYARALEILLGRP